MNHAVVNEDPNARIIRELRAEIDALKEMLMSANQPGNALTEKLNENEKLVKEMSLTWEEKLQQTEQKQGDRRHALEKMGISVQSSGIKVEKNKYFLVNLNDDPSLNELLVYYLKERTLVGRAGAEEEQDIQLMGLGIQTEHCVLEIENTELWISPLQVRVSSVFLKCFFGSHFPALTFCLPRSNFLQGSYIYSNFLPLFVQVLRIN